MKLLAGLIDEVGDEQYDIFPSFPQGRENNPCAVEAKIEIFSEALIVNGAFEFFVGGGDDANVAGSRRGLANLVKLPGLEKAQ